MSRAPVTRCSHVPANGSKSPLTTLAIVVKGLLEPLSIDSPREHGARGRGADGWILYEMCFRVKLSGSEVDLTA